MREKESDPLISNEEIRDEDARKGFMEEVKLQVGLAMPLIAVNMLQYSLQVISVMFVGHLGQLHLSSAAMATSFASVTGFSVLEWEVHWKLCVAKPMEPSITRC